MPQRGGLHLVCARPDEAERTFVVEAGLGRPALALCETRGLDGGLQPARFCEACDHRC